MHKADAQPNLDMQERLWDQIWEQLLISVRRPTQEQTQAQVSEQPGWDSRCRVVHWVCEQVSKVQDNIGDQLRASE